MDHDAFNVLFVCPDNSARSIMAEALLNRFGGDRFRGFSAGVEPAERVDRLVLELLEKHQFPTGDLKCKSSQEFCLPTAPRMHFVISLSDLRIKDRFPGDPMMACWHITDPNASGSDEVRRGYALSRAFRELESRIRLFILVRHGTPEKWNRPEPPSVTAVAALRMT